MSVGYCCKYLRILLKNDVSVYEDVFYKIKNNDIIILNKTNKNIATFSKYDKQGVITENIYSNIFKTVTLSNKNGQYFFENPSNKFLYVFVINCAKVIPGSNIGYFNNLKDYKFIISFVKEYLKELVITNEELFYKLINDKQEIKYVPNELMDEIMRHKLAILFEKSS